nr:hypothetical protein [Tanacetum cinerariifolium]
SDAAEGFEQIIDFLSGSYINHALTVNPHVFISCIKQFWNTAVVKRTGVVCLPNEEIFAGLARMGYEKPSTKLTFYKAFFSTQWKFFIYMILHSLSVRRTSWNEFSFAMASALICLSSGQRFNFSKYIFESLVRNVDSSSKFYMYPRFIQLIIQTNIADLSKHTNRYISPVLTQKVFANIRRVGKGFSGVETPLFESMLAVRVVAEEAEAQVPAQGDDVHEHAVEEVTTDVVPPTPTSPSPSSPVIPSLPHHQSTYDVENVFNQGRISVDMDQDEGIELVVDHEKDVEVEGRRADKQEEIYNIDLDHSLNVLSMQEDDTEVQEAVEVVTTAKLMTENTKGYKMELFKGKKYDEIIPIFQARFDANMKFLFKSREEIEKEDEEIIKSINETPAQKAAKRRELSEEAQEANDLRRRLEIVQDEDDDVFVEAISLAQKVPVVDYQIVVIDNKPKYKIIRA